jgi:rod shape-determining protein MreC
MAGLGWRWTRGRGAKNLSLYLCAASAVAIAFLGRADGPFFDNARSTLSDLTAPVLSQTRGPLVAAERLIASVGTFFTVYSENEHLRQQNAELRKWEHVALSLQNQMHRYEVLLNAVPDSTSQAVTARVIGEASRPFIKTMILNAGSAQQVQKGQAVVDERGLMGRIYVVGAQTSWVILLGDLNSRVPVMIEPAHRRAILTGDNTPAPKLELDVSDGPVKPGDRVLSTGDGGLLPPDLPIGTVVREGNDLRVALFARPESADFVQIKAFRLPEAPATTDPAPAATAAAPEIPLVSPATITAGISQRPAPPPMPLQSRSPNEPRFDGGQDEEQDR